MKRSIFAVGIIIIPILILNVYQLRNIAVLEKEKTNLKRLYEDKSKELEQKIIEYDNKFDLDVIKKDMEKKGMKIADNITVFELGE